MRTFTKVLGALFLLIWAALSVLFLVFLLATRAYLELRYSHQEASQRVEGQAEVHQTTDEFTLKPVVTYDYDIFKINSPEGEKKQ